MFAAVVVLVRGTAVVDAVVVAVKVAVDVAVDVAEVVAVLVTVGIVVMVVAVVVVVVSGIGCLHSDARLREVDAWSPMGLKNTALTLSL